MSAFQYEALDRFGKTQRGRLEAPSRDHALRDLRSLGLRVVSIVSANAEVPFWKRDLLGGDKPSRLDVLTFFQDLATLLGANLTVDRALRLSARQAPKRMKPSLEKLQQAVIAGQSLSDAMKAQGALFPLEAIETIRAGEMTGAIAGVTAQIAETLKRQNDMRSAIVSALIYPALLVVMAIGIIILVMSSLLPSIAPLFEGQGVAPPPPIRIAQSVGALFHEHGSELLAAAIGALAIAIMLWRKPGAKAWRDRTFRRLPLVGALLNEIDTARTCRVLGTLVGARVTLPRALEASMSIPSGILFRETLSAARRRIAEGVRLADALSPLQDAAPQMLDMIRTGEEVNRLPDMLLRAADLAEENVKTRIDRLFALLTPAITCVMGLVIGGLIVSIMSAVLSINDLAGLK